MKECKHCGLEFELPHKNSNKLFCSPECSLDFPRGFIVCHYEVCGKSVALTTRNRMRAKFCNHSCAAKHSNSSRIVNYRESFCLVCGASIREKKNSIKYCSYVCSGQAKRNETQTRILEWVRTESNWANSGTNFPSVLREYLLTEVSYKCPQCGWGVPNPITGKPILTINHIDGNWKNNRRSNLEVLCYNCHTLTETFGSLNMGSPSGKRYSREKLR